ncbi:hypothetical protein K040078D81_18250 [Blautia hominis]|uniref:Uncharacterized protein n=1 Tax=Blautia hominis TaxID=2025493 RepID=A0ABQ0B8J4_9FIRM
MNSVSSGTLLIYKNCLLMNHNDSAGYNFCYLDDEVFGEMNREAVRLTATDKDAAEELYIQM